MIYKIINYDNWKVHYAQASREDIAVTYAPEDLTAENWHYWRTLCGKDLIGRMTTDYDVDCQSCTRAFDKSKKLYEELASRFGL